MIDQLELEKCLDDRDSDFNDFDSVTSDKIDTYEENYRLMMKQVNVPRKPKIYFNLHKKNHENEKMKKDYEEYQKIMHNIKMTTGSSPLSIEKVNGKAKFVSSNQDYSEYKDQYEEKQMTEKLFKE